MTSLTDGSAAPADAAHGAADPSGGLAGGPADGLAAGLAIGGIRVAEYPSGENLPADHSPRPYLHPLRSLAGVDLTEVAPADHPHHYGVSMAVADVDGTSYWGGRTFVRGSGSTLLDNHGRQRSLGRTVVGAGAGAAGAEGAADGADTGGAGAGCDETLLWLDRAGRVQLTETRRIRARPVPEAGGWQLTWTSVLTASEGAVRIGSPATNGRPGAGYGGIFWRLPNRAGTEVLSAGGAGEAVAHGSESPWLALNQTAAGEAGLQQTELQLAELQLTGLNETGPGHTGPGASGHGGGGRVSLLLSQPIGPVRPWFVRATEYAGAGPMLAAESVLSIAAGASITTSLAGVVLDRWVTDAADAGAILAAAGLDSPGTSGATPAVLA